MYRYHDPDPKARREFCDYILNQKPKAVALVAMGPSSREFFIEGVVLEGYEIQTDEVWAINGGMMSFRHDRCFNMHDLRHVAQRVPRLGQAMMAHDRPIITTQPYPEFPTSYPFPLREVIEATRENYLNSTVAYAIAYAVMLGVKDIWMYGCDFWYPDLQRREQGGQCAAYWLGRLESFGVKFHLPQTTSLLDAMEVKEYTGEDGRKFARRPLYGYEEGAWREDFQEYDHLRVAQNPRVPGGQGAGGQGRTPRPGETGSLRYWLHGGPEGEADGDPADLGAGRDPVLGERRAGERRARVVLDGGTAPDPEGPGGMRPQAPEARGEA